MADSPHDTTLRRVYLMRHLPQVAPKIPFAWDPQAPLAPEARAMGQKIHAAHLANVRFSLRGHSLLRRASETLNSLFPELRESDKMAFRGLGPQKMHAWSFTSQMRHGTARECYDLAPDLITMEGRAVWTTMHHIVRDFLSAGQNALAVSHSPLIEVCIATAQKRWPIEHQMEKGDIAVFSFTYQGRFHSLDFLRVPT